MVIATAGVGLFSAALLLGVGILGIVAGGPGWQEGATAAENAILTGLLIAGVLYVALAGLLVAASMGLYLRKRVAKWMGIAVAITVLALVALGAAMGAFSWLS